MFLVYLLIIIFICVAINELVFKPHIQLIEGLDVVSDDEPTTYKPYTIDSSNVLILAQKNAGNIESLKGDIDEITGINSRVNEMIDNIKDMQSQINSLAIQQSEVAQNLVGDTPLTVTGMEPTNSEKVTLDIINGVY